MKNKKITFKMLLAIAVLTLSGLKLSAQKPIPLPKDGLVLYLDFSDSAKDLSIYANHGRTSNVHYTKDRFNRDNSAFNFSVQRKSFVEVLNSTSLNSSTGTYNAWFKTKGGGHRALISKVDFNNNDKEVIHMVVASSVIALVSYGNTQCKSGSYIIEEAKGINPNDGEWHMFTLVYGDNETRVYLDGKLSLKTVRKGKADTCTGDIQIGRHREGGTRYFEGDLDDIAIWNRQLDSSEIEEIFNYNALGISGLNARAVNVYPNPSQGNFTLDIPDGGAYELEVRDMQGRLIYTQDQVRDKSHVQLELAVPGIYCVALSNSKGAIYYSRLLIEQ